MTASELRELAEQVGMNAGAIARISGFSRTTIRRWMTGQRYISPTAASRLRGALESLSEINSAFMAQDEPE